MEDFTIWLALVDAIPVLSVLAGCMKVDWKLLLGI
jgi:hypothetical protein